MDACVYFLTKIFDIKKVLFSRSSVPFQNFSYATMEHSEFVDVELKNCTLSFCSGIYRIQIEIEDMKLKKKIGE